MQAPSFTKSEQAAFAGLAIFGFVVPNGLFLYHFIRDPGLLRAALANPLALTFILEAFFLMALLAWLVGRLGWRRPSPLGFVLMSLAGSLAFSVPASLYLQARQPRADRP